MSKKKRTGFELVKEESIRMMCKTLGASDKETQKKIDKSPYLEH
jgi:hypothetical protein